MYATVKPACTSLGVSMDECSNGIQAIRAISVLPALTGDLEVEGGSKIDNPNVRQKNLRFAGRVVKEKAVGDNYPVFTKFTGETQVIPLIRTMLTQEPYPIKGFICVGCNPIITWPNSNRLKKAVKKLDLFVVIDLFMTATAKMADIVLPGSSPLEREDTEMPIITMKVFLCFARQRERSNP